MKKEIYRFLIAGISAVITDFFSYYLLLDFFEVNLSKAISFFIGTVVAYLLNKFWTFEKKEKSLFEVFKFLILYTSTLIINVFTNKIVLNLTEIVFFAFSVATGISAVLNFIGQKYWVFKK